MKSIWALGAQVAGQSLEISGLGDVQLRWIAVKGSAQLEGFVLRNKRPLTGATVVLAPADARNHRGLIRANLSATDGSFVFSDLLPGNYMLLATRDRQPWESANGGAGQRSLSQAKPVLVEAGTNSTVAIELP